MIIRLKYIFTLLLVLLLFAPIIVKFEHHHNHFECKSKTEKHIHTEQEKCYICNFEFSVFSSNFNELFTVKISPLIKFIHSCYKFHNSNWSKYSFSLRAPPYLYSF